MTPMPTFAAEKMATWTGGHWVGTPVSPLSGFTADTRTLVAGQGFVALKTAQRDGHDFLEAAAARGAVAALVSQAVSGSRLAQLVVADALRALQRIAREHRREFNGTVIGVTGSVGKTSTKDLLGILLGGATHVLTTEGNLNNQLGVPLTLTKLDTTQQAYAVIEAGISGPGEMAPLAEMIEPDHSLLTLVAPAHLAGLGSLAGVAQEKAFLLAATRAGGLKVFPASAGQFEVLRRLANALVLVPENENYSTGSGRGLKFKVTQRSSSTEVTLGGQRHFRLPRVSSGMAANAALALALAGELGVTDSNLQQRIANWLPSKWRGELQEFGRAQVYCDFYNANPASMLDALEAFQGKVGANLPRLYVLGCMEELGPAAAEYHQQVGRQIHLRPADYLFVIGGSAAALREGLLENGNAADQIAVITDLQPVRARLADFTGAVFLKGSRRYQLETVLADTAVSAAH